MNYIKEINAFRNYLRTNSIPAIAQALWYAIIDYHNHSNWEPWITIDNLRLMADLEISKGTLIKHRNILIQNELLLYKSIPRKKNSGKYCLVSFIENQESSLQTGTKNKPDNVPDKPNNQSGTNFEPDLEPDLEPECEPDHEPVREPVIPGEPHCEPLPERHKLKTKLNKKDNTITKKENKEKEPWVTALDYFCEKSGKLNPNLKSRELEAAQEICNEVPSLDIVLRGIDQAFDKFKPGAEEDKINSFCYCIGPIKGLWKRENMKKNGGSKHGGTGQNTESSSYDFSRFGG